MNYDERKSSFAIHISSGGKSTSVTNDVTTGSMYAVTLDSQSITASELQGVYDEVETAGLYGMVTGISEGSPNLFVDCLLVNDVIPNFYK